MWSVLLSIRLHFRTSKKPFVLRGLEDGSFFVCFFGDFFEAFYKCVCFLKLPFVSSLATASAEGPGEVEEAAAAARVYLW